jgi:DNA-binding NarL/FixJ family response regulator
MTGPRAPITVLIIDDMEEMRSLLRDMIEGHAEFHVVGEAEDGLQGVTLAEATQPDLILLDLSMPRMDGLEALPRLRQVAPQARIVVLSGFGEERMGPTAVERGAATYLEKGATPDQIISTLLREAPSPADRGRRRPG